MTAQPLPLPSPVASFVVTVTPELAAEWLGHNLHNRGIRPQLVATYARDMANGKWALTGEAVKFAPNGDLLDGQHRLHAVIRAGVPIESLVVTGVVPEAQNVMDTGPGRRAWDVLAIREVKNASTVAAAARLGVLLELGGEADSRHAAYKPTHAEIIEWVQAHPSIIAAASTATAYRGRIDAPPSVVAYAAYLFDAIDPGESARFFHAVANVQTDGPGDPRAALIRRLAVARRSRERIPAPALLSMLVRTWNAVRAGRTLSKLPANGAIPAAI